MKISAKSRAKLKGVHPDLVRVVERFAELYKGKFIITSGLRTLAEQKILKAKGASRTLRSRHLTGHAVDISPLDPVTGAVSWDWTLYYPLAKVFKQAAKECGIPIEWGGHWKDPQDGPHWQLPWKDYPISGEKAPPRVRQKNDIIQSRTLQGGMIAVGSSGVVLVEQIKNTSEELRDVQQQQKDLKANVEVSDYLGIVISVMAIIAILAMMYFRISDGRKGV